MSEETYEKPLVLVVDDDEDIRTYLAALIRGDAETVEAADGDKGISIAKSRQPDLILLDLMMPGTDGYQVCKALKNNSATRHIPIVFITAQADRAFEAAAIKMGAIDYIVKPFDTDIVSAKIRNYLSLLNQGERLPGAIRGGASRLILPIAAAVLVAGLVVYTGVRLLTEDGSQEYAEQAAAPEGPQKQAAVRAPAVQVTPPKTAQPAPPLPVTRTPTANTPTAVTGSRVEVETAARPGRLDTTQEQVAMTDTKQTRAPGRYHWVRQASCGVVPLVEWWQNVTPSSMALYVDRHHNGEWEPYVTKWQKHLIRTENTLAKNGAMQAPNDTILKGPELREFVAKLRKRVDVVECLARARERLGSTRP